MLARGAAGPARPGAAHVWPVYLGSQRLLCALSLGSDRLLPSGRRFGPRGPRSPGLLRATVAPAATATTAAAAGTGRRPRVVSVVGRGVFQPAANELTAWRSPQALVR